MQPFLTKGQRDKGTNGQRDKGTPQEQRNKGTTQEQRNNGTKDFGLKNHANGSGMTRFPSIVCINRAQNNKY